MKILKRRLNGNFPIHLKNQAGKQFKALKQ